MGCPAALEAGLLGVDRPTNDRRNESHSVTTLGPTQSFASYTAEGRKAGFELECGRNWNRNNNDMPQSADQLFEEPVIVRTKR